MFDSNGMLSFPYVGMLFCGLGETVLNNLFAALNQPYVSPTTFKKRERETGIVFEAVADKTCDDAILDEKKVCIEKIFDEVIL